MTKTPLTVGVVGTGSIGLRHIATLRRLEGVRVVAIPVRADRIGELSSSGFECAQLGRLETWPPLHGAIVATETDRHIDDARRLLDRCAVLVEKPLAANASDGELLRASNGLVHIACVLRFNPGLGWLRERLLQIGRVHLVDVECLSWLPTWRPTRDYRSTYSASLTQGGVLRDLIHEIDYCHWLFGPFECVAAELWNTGQLDLPTGLDESAALALRTSGGARVSIRLSYAVRPQSRQLRVFGDRGALSWDALSRRARLFAPDGTVREETSWSEAADMYQLQALAWLGSLRGADPGELATLNDGIEALRIVDAARQSALAGVWVKLR